MQQQIKQGNMVWDVVVIGGGPAGMIAAGRAADRGKSVLLLEKNSTLGKKLLLSGGGRCNLTNNKPDIRIMVAQYKENAKFLFSAFSRFGVAETLEFFHKRGLLIKEENDGRLFPVSDQSQSVLDVLKNYMEQGGVKIRPNAVVAGIEVDMETSHFHIRLVNRTIIETRACVVATGGTSHPETGSTGEGFGWLQRLGHVIVTNDASLVPVVLKDEWAKILSGVTLEDVRLTVRQQGKKYQTKKGRILFTHFGVSGPTVLNMSRTIGELLSRGEVNILVDLFPGVDYGTVKERLYNILDTESNRKLKNTLAELIPSALVPAFLELSGANGELANREVRKETRTALIELCKALPLSVERLLGPEKAIVSSGGVTPLEVDFRTMESRIVPHLYLVGDVLDIDRPSGGYSLQLCWTTGFIAGESV